MRYEGMAEDQLYDLLDWYRAAAKDMSRPVAFRTQARMHKIGIADELEKGRYVGCPSPSSLLEKWESYDNG